MYVYVSRMILRVDSNCISEHHYLVDFVMEMDYVFCEAQTEFTYLIHIDIRFQCVNDLQTNVSAPANSVYKLGCTRTQNAECIA